MTGVQTCALPILLVTQGSRLLELEDIRNVIGPFDEQALAYPWKHPDPEMDVLAAQVFSLVAGQNLSRQEIFAKLWKLAHGEPLPDALRPPRATHEPPHMDEPWYCCAEPAPQV